MRYLLAALLLLPLIYAQDFTPTALRIDPAEAILAVGDQYEFQVFAVDQRSGFSGPFAADWYVTGNIGYIRQPVQGQQRVTFIATTPGNGTVNAGLGSASGSARIRVIQNELANIGYNPRRVNVVVGETLHLEVEGRGQNGQPADLPSNITVRLMNQEGTVGVLENLSLSGSKATADFRAVKPGYDTLIISIGSFYEEIPVQVRYGNFVRLMLNPDNYTARPGESVGFDIIAIDEFNFSRVLNPNAVNWSTTLGRIDERGMFRADQPGGNGTVTASWEGLNATAHVQIRQEPSPSPVPSIEKTPTPQQDEGPEPIMFAVPIALLILAYLALRFLGPRIFRPPQFLFPKIPPGSSLLLEGAVDSPKRELAYSLLSGLIKQKQQVAILSFDASEHETWIKKQDASLLQNIQVPGDLTRIGVRLTELLDKKPSAIYLPIIPTLLLNEKLDTVVDFLQFNMRKAKDHGATLLFTLEIEGMKKPEVATLEVLFDFVAEVKREAGMPLARLKKQPGAEPDARWKRV